MQCAFSIVDGAPDDSAEDQAELLALIDEKSNYGSARESIPVYTCAYQLLFASWIAVLQSRVHRRSRQRNRP